MITAFMNQLHIVHHTLNYSRTQTSRDDDLPPVKMFLQQMSPLATFWPQGFSYPKVSMKSAYATVLASHMNKHELIFIEF